MPLHNRLAISKNAVTTEDEKHAEKVISALWALGDVINVINVMLNTMIKYGELNMTKLIKLQTSLNACDLHPPQSCDLQDKEHPVDEFVKGKLRVSQNARSGGRHQMALKNCNDISTRSASTARASLSSFTICTSWTKKSVHCESNRLIRVH